VKPLFIIIAAAAAGTIGAAVGVAALLIVQSPTVHSPGPLESASLRGTETVAVTPRSDPASPRAPQARRQSFGDWLLLCPEAASEPCSALQNHVRAEDRQAIFVVSLGSGNNSSREIAFLTPLGVLLEPGVELKIAGDPVLHAKFTRCQPGQCRASGSLSAAAEARLAAAEQVTAAFRLASGQQVDVSISVDGLGHVVNALDAAARH
jgi:invasion protein IalB